MVIVLPSSDRGFVVNRTGETGETNGCPFKQPGFPHSNQKCGTRHCHHETTIFISGCWGFQDVPSMSRFVYTSAVKGALVTSDPGVQPAGDWRWSITWCLPARKKTNYHLISFVDPRKQLWHNGVPSLSLVFLHLHWVDLEKNSPISTSPKNPPAWTSDFAATRSHQRLQRSRLKGWSILASYKIL